MTDKPLHVLMEFLEGDLLLTLSMVLAPLFLEHPLVGKRDPTSLSCRVGSCMPVVLRDYPCGHPLVASPSSFDQCSFPCLNLCLCWPLSLSISQHLSCLLLLFLLLLLCRLKFLLLLLFRSFFLILFLYPPSLHRSDVQLFSPAHPLSISSKRKFCSAGSGGPTAPS